MVKPLQGMYLLAYRTCGTYKARGVPLANKPLLKGLYNYLPVYPIQQSHQKVTFGGISLSPPMALLRSGKKYPLNHYDYHPDHSFLS